MTIGKLGLLGLGKMGQAILKRLIETDIVNKKDVRFTCLTEEENQTNERSLGVSAAKSNNELWDWSDTILLAVKPQQSSQAFEELKFYKGKSKLCISIMAGTRLATLESGLPKESRIIRTMPNTPALVGWGATGIFPGTGVTKDDLEKCRRIFGSVGIVVETTHEDQLDAVVGLSGSGPAYVFLFLEALADGGVMGGLPHDVALKLACQTVAGAAMLAIESKLQPGTLKDQVTSKGGTTIAALAELEKHGFRGAILDAMSAAIKRSKELGQK